MDFLLLPTLAFMTMGIVVAVAIWSKKRTKDREKDPTAPTSSLARKSPDPQFRPDPDVTDPHHVRH